MKKKSSPHFGTFSSPFWNFPFFHFQFSTFPFTISLDFFSMFPLFTFFPSLFFPGRSVEISQSDVSGGTLPPAPPPPPVTPLLLGIVDKYRTEKKKDTTKINLSGCIILERTDFPSGFCSTTEFVIKNRIRLFVS